MGGHPNATAALVAGALGTIVVWILGELDIAVPEEVAGAIVTLFTAAILFVGRPRSRRR